MIFGGSVSKKELSKLKIPTGMIKDSEDSIVVSYKSIDEQFNNSQFKFNFDDIDIILIPKSDFKLDYKSSASIININISEFNSSDPNLKLLNYYITDFISDTFDEKLTKLMDICSKMEDTVYIFPEITRTEIIKCIDFVKEFRDMNKELVEFAVTAKLIYLIHKFAASMFSTSDIFERIVYDQIEKYTELDSEIYENFYHWNKAFFDLSNVSEILFNLGIVQNFNKYKFTYVGSESFVKDLIKVTLIFKKIISERNSKYIIIDEPKYIKHLVKIFNRL